MVADTEASILERVIDPEGDVITPETARALLGLDFKPTDHRRMHELSLRAQDGSLTPQEEEELGNSVNVSHFLALLHSKARLSLNKNHPGN